MNIQILMSTYNGEKYIRTQLNSILEQEYQDFDLLIRDDGSTDHTCEIIKEYAENYPNITWYAGENLGVQKSFFDLILKANLEKDYYAFADQDDKWLPGKISRAVSILDTYSEEIPVLYCSDKIIVDEELRPLKNTVSRVMKKPSFGNALVQDMCTGCTAVINKALLTLMRNRIPDYVIMHDWWFYLTASCFGEVYYDEKSYILYRQHGNNTSGAMVSRHELIRYRIQQLSKPRGEIHRQAQTFLEVFNRKSPKCEKSGVNPPTISPTNRELITDLLKSRVNPVYRLKVIMNPRFFRQKTSDNLVLKLIILIGKL